MKRWHMLLLLIIPLALLIFSVIRACDKWAYFELPFYWVLSLTITVFVVYWLTQRNTDKRREIDIISAMLAQSISDLSNPKMYDFEANNNGNFHAYAQYELLSNRLHTIEDYLKRTKDQSQSICCKG